MKTVIDILKSNLGGPVALEKHVKSIKWHDRDDLDKVNKMIEKASDHFMSFTCLENADQGKCGLVLRNLNSQKSLRIDQFLKKFTEATNILSENKF